MLGHDYHQSFTSLTKSKVNMNENFHSPFMYRSDSSQDLEAVIPKQRAYRRMSSFDTSGTNSSCDSMDDIQKALKKNDAKEKKTKTKGRGGRRTQTLHVEPVTKRRPSTGAMDGSAKSTKSLPVIAGQSAGKSMLRVGSNQSLASLAAALPPPREKLESSFGNASWLRKPGFGWDKYFRASDDEKGMTRELEKAIFSGKAKNLKKLWLNGLSMNTRNKHGESVVHLVCRQGCVEQLIFLMMEAKVSVRVRDHANKHPLHEVAWSPKFDPSLAMMLISDSPELLWAKDSRGFLALDYVPKRALLDWYNFLEHKQPVIKLALEFSRWQDTCRQLNTNQQRLHKLLEKHTAARGNTS